MRQLGEPTDVRSSLSDDDQRDLIWFFGPGQVCFERSTFGPQLDHAELFTFGSMPCPKCDGRGYEGSMELSIRRAIENVQRWQADNAARIAEGKAGRLPPAYDDGMCRRCGGGGRVPCERRLTTERHGAITAKPMGYEVRAPKPEPDSNDLERYGWISHRLGQLDRYTVAVLVGFFGWGTNWENDPKLGRIFGVASLTAAGKTLLRRARGTGKTKKKRKDEAAAAPDASLTRENALPDDMVLATEVELEGITPKPGRRKLLDEARQQGEEMLRRAEDSWRALTSEQRRRDKRRAERQRVEKWVRSLRVAPLVDVGRIPRREIIEVTRAGAR